jgi:hypothetical protein
VLCIDLYCGLGGWAEGFLSEGWDVIGFDIERHDYGTGGYPGQLVLQDVTTLHGSQFRNADVIVASPPCQAYSYRAMPWKRAKALPPPDNTLFETCFRIQREANSANYCGLRGECLYCGGAGWYQNKSETCECCYGSGKALKYIPMIVENVRGAEKWVGAARWHFGSFYLWGDVPPLMPPAATAQKFNPDGTARPSGSWFKISDSKNRGARSSVGGDGDRNRHTPVLAKPTGAELHGSGIASSRTAGSIPATGVKNNGGSWFAIGSPGQTNVGQNPDGRKVPMNFHEHEKTGKPGRSFQSQAVELTNTKSRKAASAAIAKIPFPLAQHIARVFKPA